MLKLAPRRATRRRRMGVAGQRKMAWYVVRIDDENGEIVGKMYSETRYAMKCAKSIFFDNDIFLTEVTEDEALELYPIPRRL
jgi:hypothetical protein